MTVETSPEEMSEMHEQMAKGHEEGVEDHEEGAGRHEAAVDINRDAAEVHDETGEAPDEAVHKKTAEGQGELQPFDFRALVPAEWTARFGSWVWLRFYRAMRLSEDDLKRKFKTVKTRDAIAFLLYGQPILPQPAFRFASSDPPVIEAHLGKPLMAPLATYLGTLVPYCRGPSDDFLARCATDSWVGLLRASLGENIAYEQVAEYGLSLEDGSLNFFSPAARNPQVDPEPAVSDADFAFLRSCYGAIDELPTDMGNRVRLALRWYELSSRQSGVDAFLNQWVALEALGMERQNNVRPIVKTLAISYGIDQSETSKKFGIGPIFGLRSEIMHRGLIPIIHQDLQRYLRGIFRDLLFAKVGLPHRREAESVLNRGDFNLKDLLNYARAVPSNNAAADGPRKRGR